MSQYDEIGSKYAVFKTLPVAIVENDNVHDAVRDRISGARVLDLACGLGYYSHRLLEWGASYVLGVDLSSEMVDGARMSVPPSAGTVAPLQFRVGNAMTLGKIEDQEPFDIVLGVWLLNYSASSGEMTQMFETISANLRPGGIFVSVTPHPAEDLDAFATIVNEFEKEQPAKWGASVIYHEKLSSGEGWGAEITARAGTADEVKFRNFHLHHTAYEQAARTGGMNGKLEWRKIQIPDRAIEKMGEEYWSLFHTKGPSLGILVVEM